MQNRLIHTNIEDFADYLKDESRISGHADSISFPQTVEEISSVLHLIRNEEKSITIQGARTGITGGAVPHGGHILNLSRMNRILALCFDEDSDRFFMKVQPGLILSELRQKISGGHIDTTEWDNDSIDALKTLKRKGTYFFPPDPTEPSASVGGMAACNASGACSFLYGPTRRYVQALTILLADGSIVSLKRGKQKATGRCFSLSANSGKTYKGNLPSYVMPVVKNASGYYARDNMDLLDLFTGSEGTLGIIAEMEITLIKKPSFTWGITSFLPRKEIIPFVRSIRGDHLAQGFAKGLPIFPAAIEFFDTNSLTLLKEMKKKHAAFTSLPQIPDGEIGAVYVEFHADNEDILNDAVLCLSDIITDCGGNEDTTWFATEPHELERLTLFRHAVPEAVNLYIDMRKKNGLAITKLGTDMAVQNSLLQDIYTMYHTTLKENKLNSVMFGHIGDNHIHVNILPESEEEYETGKALYREWAEQITGLGGSVSAEHGIGKLKTDFLTIMYGEKGVREMWAVKKLFDPHMIFNPGSLFPAFAS